MHGLTPKNANETGETRSRGAIAALQAGPRLVFGAIEAWLDRIFTPSWNPLYQLGALGFFYYWVVTVSGVYVYILFDTSVLGAYHSVEAMTIDQWYAGGVMRSLHRYASDAMVLLMGIHMVREWALDRHRGARWFTWVSGLPLVGLVLGAGITGYWLVWDKLAQYTAIIVTEWLDWLPIFGKPIASNFLTPESLNDRFFTLLVFIHIALPIIMLVLLWIHLQRVSRPKINPPLGLAVGSFLMLLLLALVKPALSQGPADLNVAPAVVGLDWFYLGLTPLMELWSRGATWGLAAVVSVILAALPWLPPMRRPPAARVNLDNCNGCTRCVADCPYNAISMQPRSDGRPFEQEAVVNPSVCVSCGICVGACPSSTPFRRMAELVTGIDTPGFSLDHLRNLVAHASMRLSGRRRIMIFGCDHGFRVERLGQGQRAAISLPCIAMMPPSMIDYVLSRALADGAFMVGCREGNCHNRFGVHWMEDRIAQRRDPHLRSRVPRERLVWQSAGPGDGTMLARALDDFEARLAELEKDASNNACLGGSAARAAQGAPNV